MCRKSSISLLLIILLSLGVKTGFAQEGVVNLLPNGGLETGDTSGWEIPGNLEVAEVVSERERILGELRGQVSIAST